MGLLRRKNRTVDVGQGNQVFVMREDHWEQLDLKEFNIGSDFFRNVWNVYRCIRIVSDAVSACGVNLVRKNYGKDGEDEQVFLGEASRESLLLSFLASRASRAQSGADLRWMVAAQLQIYGKAFLHTPYYTGGDKRPINIAPLPPLAMDIKRGPNTEEPIRAFVQRRAKGENITYTPDEVCYIRMPDPDDILGSVSPMDAAAGPIRTQELSAKWNERLIKNGAKVPYLIHYRGRMSPEQKKIIKDSLLKKWTGPDNAGLPHVTIGDDAEVKVIPLALSPMDMDWLNSKKTTLREIAGAFGVPPELLGDTESKTYSNAVEAGRALYTKTALPLLRKVLDALSMHFFYDASFRVVTHQYGIVTSGIVELQKDLGELSTALAAAWWLSPNQRLDAMGFPRSGDEAMDKIYVPAGITPIDELGMTDDDLMPARDVSGKSEPGLEIVGDVEVAEA